MVALRNSVHNVPKCAKVRATKSRRNFLQRTHLIHPIDPKLTFWCIAYYLGAFGTVLWPHETRCKTGRTSAKVRATKSRRNFSQCTRSIPLDPKLKFGCVSYILGAFGIVWLPYETRCKNCRTSAKVRATKSRRNLSQRSHPIHPIGPQTDVLVRFILFGCIQNRFVALRNSVQNGPIHPVGQ